MTKTFMTGKYGMVLGSIKGSGRNQVVFSCFSLWVTYGFMKTPVMDWTQFYVFEDPIVSEADNIIVLRPKLI